MGFSVVWSYLSCKTFYNSFLQEHRVHSETGIGQLDYTIGSQKDLKVSAFEYFCEIGYGLRVKMKIQKM